MAFEMFFKRENSEYNEGIIFQEYRDNFYLVSGGKGQHAVWKKFCFPQRKDKTPTDTAIPMGVNLGNRHEAIKMFKSFLKALGNETS
jgi:hypothetical protein